MNVQRDDILKQYTTSEYFAIFYKITFLVNFILSIINVVIANIPGIIPIAYRLLYCLQILTVFVYVGCSIIDDGILWYSAESKRRRDSIQNAFGANLSELKTIGYYNNSLNPSMLKYAVNTFESNYHSMHIAKEMLSKSAARSVSAIIVLFILGFVFQNGGITLVVSQAVFSSFIIQETIFLVLYYIKLDELYKRFYDLLIANGLRETKQLISLLSFCVEYECIKAHYKVRLNSKIFSKTKTELSEKWEDIYSKIVVTLNDDQLRL